jgi:hypothetical protein
MLSVHSDSAAYCYLIAMREFKPETHILGPKLTILAYRRYATARSQAERHIDEIQNSERLRTIALRRTIVSIVHSPDALPSALAILLELAIGEKFPQT